MRKHRVESSSSVPEEFQKYESAAVWLPVEVVRRWAQNPRDNAAAIEPVANSISRFGFVAPICIWSSKQEMVAGHTRLSAYERLTAADASFVPRGAPGPGLVPVRFHEFASAAEAHAYALADNKLGEIAQWDMALLPEVMLEFKEERILFDATGFDFSTFFAAEMTEGGPDPDAVPEVPKNPVTKKGDIWALGEHRLICGDCRDAKVVGRLFGKQKANIAFTSPPYASQRKYDETSGFKPIHPDKFVEWFEPVQAHERLHVTDDGSWFVNIKEGSSEGQRLLYVKDLVLAHVRSWDWKFIDEFCWRNTRNGTPGVWPNRFKNAFEPVFQFAKGTSIKFRPKSVAVESDLAFKYEKSNEASKTNGILLGKHAAGEAGMALPSNVLEIAPSSESDHGAAFPVALPEFFVKAFSDAGDIVFDPFMGSGTTLMACEHLGRKGLGAEISPGYCDVVVERWQAFTGKKAVRSSA